MGVKRGGSDGKTNTDAPDNTAKSINIRNVIDQAYADLTHKGFKWNKQRPDKLKALKHLN